MIEKVKNKKAITKSQRKEFLIFYNFHCHRCLEAKRINDADVSRNLENATCSNELHHIKPRHDGGSNELGNVVLLCSNHHQGYHLRNDAVEVSTVSWQLNNEKNAVNIEELGKHPKEILESIHSILKKGKGAIDEKELSYILLLEAEAQRKLGKINTCLTLLKWVDKYRLKHDEPIGRRLKVTEAKAMASLGNPKRAWSIINKIISESHSDIKDRGEEFNLVTTRLNSQIQRGQPIMRYKGQLLDLKASLEKSKNTSGLGMAILFEASLHQEMGDYVSQASCYDRAHKLLYETDIRGSAMALRNKARVLSILDRHEESIDLFKHAKKMFCDYDDYWGFTVTGLELADAMMRAMQSHNGTGQNPSDIAAEYDSGIGWLESWDDRHLLPVALDNVAYLNQLVGNMEGAIKARQRSEHIRANRDRLIIDDVTYLQNFYRTL
ncbi:MAG: hypothetical protein PHU14_07880 [Methylovulum sp.]|nr:hypothetical protein [Methylovulum sp.]